MSKIFGTDGIRCIVNKEPLTTETCLKISKTVAYLLRKKNNQNSNKTPINTPNAYFNK